MNALRPPPTPCRPTTIHPCRFFESSIAGKEALVEKLRVRNGTLKVATSKLEAQLAQEEGMGEVLRQVDVEQLKIENQQLSETIHGKNQEMLQMKRTTAKTMQVRAHVLSAQRCLAFSAPGARVSGCCSVRQRPCMWGAQSTWSRSVRGSRAWREAAPAKTHYAQPRSTPYTSLQALNDVKSLLTKLDFDSAALRQDIVQRTGERTILAAAQSKATAEVQTARRSIRSPSETLKQNE